MNRGGKKNVVLFIIADWNAKVGIQEIPGVTSEFGFGVQNEAGQRLTEFCQENTLVIANTLFQQLFPIVAVSIYISTNARGFPFLHTLSSIYFCRLYDDHHSDWCKVIAHCSFDFHFFSNEQC